MHQNAPFQRRKYKIFSGEGADPTPTERGILPPQTPPPSAPPFLEPPPNHISGYGPAAVSNIRPTGHNPTRQVFLSSLRGLPEMSKMIDLCVSGVNFQALKYAETRFMHPLPIPFPPGCPRHLDLAPD